MHDDFREQLQARLRLAPDPFRQILAGRIFQARNLVQQLMIDAIENRLERCAHVSEVHHPAGVRIDRPRYMQLDTKGMSVQTRALVPRRHVRQAMSGFDGEGAEDLHAVRLKPDHDYAALRRRELDAQLQVPQVQRIELQSPQTVKSTEPK